MSDIAIAQLVELGVLDADAPDAEVLVRLVRLALDHGATFDEIRAGIDEHRLHAVAAERVVLVGTRITLREAAARAGVDVEFAQAFWRASGFADAGLDAAICTEGDVEVLELCEYSAQILGRPVALQLARTNGSALARMADATIAVVRSRIEAPIRAEGGNADEVTEAFVVLATDLLPRLYPSFEQVHRRHLTQAARRYSLWESEPSIESTTFAVIGFADLVGFTALTQEIAASDLDELLSRFEQHVLDAIPPEGARLVKLIGDEAMFVAGGVDQAVSIARELIQKSRDDPGLAEVRIGLAAGEVLIRDGDVFGPTVNRASRLVTVAEPSTPLVDQEVAVRLGPERAHALGLRKLPGFDTPIAVFELIG
ncbi:MAG: adenylate/guanylate cyclase domain-containing protein [Acidimicrobiia bacterium]